jgi:hypothetical protein
MGSNYENRARVKTSVDVRMGLHELASESTAGYAVVTLLLRMAVELEALREALASPEVPEAVRDSYREAYARIAVLSHNSAGPYGSTEKILARFIPRDPSAEPFTPELEMMARLGSSVEEREALRAKMEEVEFYT